MGLDDNLRRRYLAAMGIELWEARQGGRPVAVAPERDSGAEAVSPSAPLSAELAALDWEALRARVAGCVACELHAARTQTVFGVGDPQAQLMLVGEAPGVEEDRRGEPFVGRAGRLLDEMLAALGLGRERVYIANILKCRPPNNRDPQAEEIARCAGYLARQVELVQPTLILALGRIAAQNLLKTTVSLSRLRGEVHGFGAQPVPVLVTYHPAYLLRTPQDKGKAWQDLRRARAMLEQRGARA